MLIYIIAGEASGDNIGAGIIREFKKKYNDVTFIGIGGPAMLQEGLSQSLFDIAEISIMGFIEILPKIFRIKKLIASTIVDIIKNAPDILITIDSPGFCYRVAKKIALTGLDIKMFHVVAPTVWAYKEYRAKNFAEVYRHLFAILPFEPPFFEKYGLATTYIGHPSTQHSSQHSHGYLMAKYNLQDSDKILTLIPGSRESEIKRLLPIFLQTSLILKEKIDNLHICILVATKELMMPINNILQSFNLKNIMIEFANDKDKVMIDSTCILAKSGTNNIEIALCGKPFIVAYKMNFFSWLYIKSILKIKYACILNIIAKKQIVTEFLQQNCKPALMSQELYRLIANKYYRGAQIAKTTKIIQSLGCPEADKNCYRMIVDEVSS